ncbi:hypothetical protein F5Y07DRAFT_84326 [Xylaria sp. FL0933]|nr:hypothetical protein F5Y07DRAFT_84326 [Xylaria sp. FL0933]
MSYHGAPSYYATNKDRDQRCQNNDNRPESGQQSSVPHERVQGSTGQLRPFASSLQDHAHMRRDDLIDLLVLERYHYVEALRFLGFEHQTAEAIVRRWITLKMDAAAGGPYDLLGVALAAIAELGESGGPDMRACHGDPVGRWEAPPRSDWLLIFAQVLNEEAITVIQHGGVYFAPDFAKAKRLVYHMVRIRWERLLGPRPATPQAVPVPMMACY